MEKLDVKVGFVGGGAMAQAIAEGLLQSGLLGGADILASGATERTRGWWEARGAQFTTDNCKVVEGSEVVLLSVKPHLYSGVLQEMQAKGFRCGEKLWVSIMAGVLLEDLKSALSLVTDRVERVVRTIPNTPVKVRKGSVGVTFSPGCLPRDREVVFTMFSSVSSCAEIPERLQNAFAAMAGSGPAYIYQVVEALADGGVMMGLPRALAMQQAAAMVEGAAAMVTAGAQEQPPKHPAALKDEVCSPGGSTIRGVQKLEEGGVRAAFMGAVEAAALRNEELGKK